MKLPIIGFVVLVTACGSRRPDGERAPPSPSDAPMVFDVHEWGLMDVFPDEANGTSSADILGGPSRVAGSAAAQVVDSPSVHNEPTMHNVPRKPVLYFHHESGPLGSVTAGVRIPNGQLVEIWPDQASRPVVSQATTFQFTLDGMGSCPVDQSAVQLSELCGRSPAPDGYCERLELPTYQTTDATCLRYPSQDHGGSELRAPFLFYRAERRNEPLSALPIAVQTNVLFRNQFYPAALSRANFRENDARRYFRIRYHQGQVQIVSGLLPVASDRPAASPSEDPFAGLIFLGEPQTDVLTTPEEATRLCESDLVAQGLRRSEADAFVRAWRHELFEGHGVADSQVILFWLPESYHHLVSELSITPQPRAIRRALMVRYRWMATAG